MEIKIHDVNNKEGEIDVLVDSFRSPFWLEEHGWLVRCDWMPDKQYTYAILYTLPYAFDSFDFNVPILSKSTSPHHDNHWPYNCVRNLHCNMPLTGELSMCHFQFRNIHSMSLKLPVNDQFWSIVSRLDQLTSLNVLFDNDSDMGQSQLQSLLNRTSRLYSLRIKSCSPSTQQVLLTGKSRNLSILRLFSQGYSQCFYNQACIALSASSLGMQCEMLQIKVNNRTDIITLINRMTKLRALYVYCCDDKRNEKSTMTNDELVEWLQQHLPPMCTISRDKHLFYMIRIWIR
ncbi:unnamed protein product [Rotaria sordida]|uniref:Uncharacterized protein n=1 Tax=Rotaria sordida TaxID=392033 RepID=A0A818U312_9BILA|nr:unnamed protein product [Rotaria sordida]CAF1260400.1 unnamed protein product [Rotaria sordida]CAF3692384.1 unnamed protein product [Rotaria sordida]CAF3937383.1 unnamed protein product [Rotaria sordida]